jgi:hypothetical protein
MWNQSTLTIVFRGLLVFHKLVDASGRAMFEIGVLLTLPSHIPRIITIRNGVLADILPLESLIKHAHPYWRLDVDNPIGNGVSTYTAGEGPVHRMDSSVEKDFRLINDLESADFYGEDLTEKLDTRVLEPILHVPHGIFYTRLKSPEVNKFKDHEANRHLYRFASVTGCDIPLFGGGATLVEEDTGHPIFTFENTPNTIYEFTNTPPDVHGHDMMPAATIDQQAGDATHHGTESHDDDPPDHFQFYYNLFRDPAHEDKFHFETPSPSTAPHPALCGALMLGKRKSSLR